MHIRHLLALAATVVALIPAAAANADPAPITTQIAPAAGVSTMAPSTATPLTLASVPLPPSQGAPLSAWDSWAAIERNDVNQVVNNGTLLGTRVGLCTVNSDELTQVTSTGGPNPYPAGVVTDTVGGSLTCSAGTGSYNAISFGETKYGGNYVTGDATAPAANYNAVPATTGSDGWTTGPGGVSMGTIPPAAFTGGAISMASVPQYISVISQGTVVGYVASTTVLPSQGTPVSAATLEPPVYDASLSQVVGHLVSGEGFVPVAGSTLPATDSNGNSTSVTVLQAPPPQN